MTSWITPSNPPGYHREEVALSHNAYSLSTSLRDEDGDLLPLFFRSFGDYKSPVYPVTGQVCTASDADAGSAGVGSCGSDRSEKPIEIIMTCETGRISIGEWS